MADEEWHLRLQLIMNEQREKERALIKNADFKTFKNLPHNWWLNTKLCKARIEDLIENIYNVPPHI